MTDKTKAIETAIDDIHNFFTDWVNGTCPGDDKTFNTNAADKMNDNLVVVMPAGMAFGKSDFEGYMKGIYGSNPDFKIKIRDVKLRHSVNGIHVVNYNEWQRGAKDSDDPENARMTTMVLRDTPDGDLEFMQVHETWLPKDIAVNGDYNF